MTCSDTNADGTDDDFFPCTGESNSADPNPSAITCDDSGCDAVKCCTVPRLRTCVDTDADGERDEYICSLPETPNGLDLDPENQICDDDGCDAERCCTDEPIPRTCSDTNADGVEDLFSCPASGPGLNGDIECDASGCTEPDCCIVLPRTCSDTDADGVEDLFECDGSNSLDPDGICHPAFCADTDCCTVRPIQILDQLDSMMSPFTDTAATVPAATVPAAATTPPASTTTAPAHHTVWTKIKMFVSGLPLIVKALALIILLLLIGKLLLSRGHRRPQYLN